MARKKVTALPAEEAPPVKAMAAAFETERMRRDAIRKILLVCRRKDGRQLNIISVAIRVPGSSLAMIREIRAEMEAAGEIPPYRQELFCEQESPGSHQGESADHRVLTAEDAGPADGAG